ncbi:MAG: diacylglycerol kinase family lipid kinase [Planctomycetes bacterium]|nr:diacylglycerol kinase family lipid kinase [Planctomycetota bacterium]
MRSSVVIVNEKANWGSGQYKVGQVMAFLNERGLPTSVRATEYPGHARELAATAAAQGIDTVIVIGGDGTVNEVVSGLLASGRNEVPGIAVIPAGSSNDFSKSLGIPQRWREACDVIVRGRVREVDVGQAGPHYFCSASCLGYFAEVAARSHAMKKLRGSLRYVIPAFGVIRNMTEGWEMTVKAEGRVLHGNYAVLLVGNAPRFGGLTMLPGARPDDGRLDCLLIEMAGRWEALQLIPLVYRKALERHKRATRFQAASLSVTLTRPTLVCNDGEMVRDVCESLEYRLIPQRLRILC